MPMSITKAVWSLIIVFETLPALICHVRKGSFKTPGQNKKSDPTKKCNRWKSWKYTANQSIVHVNHLYNLNSYVLYLYSVYKSYNVLVDDVFWKHPNTSLAFLLTYLFWGPYTLLPEPSLLYLYITLLRIYPSNHYYWWSCFSRKGSYNKKPNLLSLF